MLALNLRVHPLASLSFCSDNVYTVWLCTYTSSDTALTLMLALALTLFFYINTYPNTASALTLMLALALTLLFYINTYSNTASALTLSLTLAPTLLLH